VEIHYKVTYSGGRTVDAVTKPKDMVAFERQYNLPFHESSRAEHVFYLAWSPLHRSGVEPRAFDEFLDDVEDVAEVKGATETDPFPPAQSGEESPG
jgi:hypothetical protein